MTESNGTPQRTTLGAVDIVKHYHDVLIEPATRGRGRRLRLANNLESYYRKLWIDDVMKKAAYPSA